MTMKNPLHLTDSSLEKLSRHSGRMCTILEFCIKAKDYVDKEQYEELEDVAFQIGLNMSRDMMNDVYDIFKQLSNRRLGP